jgi:hypothetical protein
MPRAALLVAALVLALLSRGDVIVLALLLGFGAGRRLSGLASAGALLSAHVRWGSSSLGAIAGAQAVLGPAGWTGSGAAIAAAWFAAVALVLAAVPLFKTNVVVVALSVAPFAVAAADVVVGPAPGGALALRVLATAVAIGLTTVLVRAKRLARVIGPVAVACGLLAVVCAGVSR